MKKLGIGIVSIVLGLASCQNAPQQAPQETAQPDKNVVVETILKRRSIRAFKSEQISEKELQTMIECGINAPSAMNKQSWEVRIIQEPALVQSLESGIADFSKNRMPAGAPAQAPQSALRGAPTVVVVSREIANSASYIDCALFVENFIIAAESMDIGTGIVGSVTGYLADPASKTVTDKLGIPDTHEPYCAILVGYKNERPDAKPRDASKVKILR